MPVQDVDTRKLVEASHAPLFICSNDEDPRLIDEIGIDVVVITSGPRKDTGSAFREMSEEEQALWKEIIDQVYEDFVEIVAQARGLSIEDTRELADGRVYTGRQAFELGLVDELGIPADAIAKAAELGSISGKPRIVEYEHLPGLGQVLTGLGALASQSDVDKIFDLVTQFSTPALEYRYVGPQQ